MEKEVRRHPTLEVECPDCKDNPGEWCNNCEGSMTVPSLEGRNLLAFIENCGFRRWSIQSGRINGPKVKYYVEAEVD